MIYDILIIIACIFTFSSSIVYLLAHLKKIKIQNIARLLLFIAILIIVFFCGNLISLIINHNFNYSYVFFNTSKSLPFSLLLSSFYAGQEGSFLLWLFLISLIAIIAFPKIKNLEYENIAYSIVSIVIFFFLLFIYFKNPFTLLSEVRPDDYLNLLKRFPNGYGINPVLENIWMIIHPPILFIGYSTVLITFILAMSALVKNDYINWIKLAIPWTIFSNIFLGLGIILGGLWSYETLGWGGYWAWDPVENSSLIPWIIIIGLSHSLLVQKRTGGLIKTNLILSFSAFILVIYSTFLTRSGILSDFSVHTFEKSENTTSILIIIFIGFLLALSVILFFIRYSFLSKLKNKFNYATKEYFISLGITTLLLSAFIIFIGTNLPIIQQTFSLKPKKLETYFYTNWNLPIMFLASSLLFISILLNWKKASRLRNIKIIVSFLIISFVVLIISLVVNNLFLANILLITVSIIAFISNTYYFLRKLVGFYQIGSYLSHIGFSLLIIGAILSGVYSEQHIIELKQNEVKDTLGFNIEYVGSELIQDKRDDLDNYKFNIVLNEKNNEKKFNLNPKYKLFPQKKQQAFEPAIASTIFRDIYISPFMLNKQYDIPFIKLYKDETQIISIDSNYTITFKDIIFHKNSTMADIASFIGFVLEFHNTKENAKLVDTVYVKIDLQTGELEEFIYNLPSTDIKLIINQFKMRSEKTPSYINIGLAFFKDFPLKSKELLTIELSIKPYIIMVWFGSFCIILGFFFSIFRHFRNHTT